MFKQTTKIIIAIIIFFNLNTIANGAETICGSLTQFVYFPNSYPPKMGCLYIYNPYDNMNPLTLRVLQSINGGILVSADHLYYGPTFPDTKNIFIQTSKQFVDGQLLRDKEIVKYVGYYDYISAFGVKRKVYKFYRYGKYEIEKNVDKSALKNYQYEQNPIKTINNTKDYISTYEVDEYFKSLKIAENEFKNTIDKIPTRANDEKFRIFLFKYYEVIENLNNFVQDGINQLTYEDANNTDNFDDWSIRAKKIVKYYEEHGISVVFIEGTFVATAKTDYLTSFYKYLTPQYKKWLNFEKKLNTEIGIVDNSQNKLYEIVKEGKDYYKN